MNKDEYTEEYFNLKFIVMSNNKTDFETTLKDMSNEMIIDIFWNYAKHCEELEKANVGSLKILLEALEEKE